MPTAFESEINILLRDMGDAGLVAEELLRRWKMNLFDEKEQDVCARFLVASGFYPTLFSRINELCANQARLPWGAFAEAIGKSFLSVEPNEIAAILEGAGEQDALEDLLRSKELDRHSPALKERRAQQKGLKALAVAERKQALQDKLEFMRNNRLFSEEAKVLEEIQRLFPEEPEFTKERQSFEVRWAREVISSSTSVTDPTADLEWKVDRLTPEQQTSKGLIVARAKELVRSNPRLAYDLAVCLHFMDFNSEAIEILEHADSSPAADWLRLELMLKARQFVTALDEASRLEIEHAGDPETAFAIVYARARALWGLGQGTMAIDLLRSLVRIRPNYKSAQSLLMDWTGGDS